MQPIPRIPRATAFAAFVLGATIVATPARAQRPQLSLNVRQYVAIDTDVVVLTHAHPDHCGGLPAVIEHLGAGEIWISPRRLRRPGTFACS